VSCTLRPDNHNFTHLDRLEALLIDFPDVTIVLSRSRQKPAMFDHLKGVFVPTDSEGIEGGTVQPAVVGSGVSDQLAAAKVRAIADARENALIRLADLPQILREAIRREESRAIESHFGRAYWRNLLHR
jgi:hypothetical protein